MIIGVAGSAGGRNRGDDLTSTGVGPSPAASARKVEHTPRRDRPCRLVKRTTDTVSETASGLVSGLEEIEY
jgi:hypothetical protein